MSLNVHVPNSAEQSTGVGELSGFKIMMVEDDAFFTDIIMTKLVSHGCIPFSTATGADALSLAKLYEPDLIILDLMLPVLSGEEILQQLKASDALKHIPVIVFSNKSEQTDIEANLQAGAAEYLVKSATDFNTLVDIVKGTILKARQAQA